MSHIELALSNIKAIKPLVDMLPIAEDVRTMDEYNAFDLLISAKFERLLKQYPEYRDRLATVAVCVSGAALASLENHAGDNKNDNQ